MDGAALLSLDSLIALITLTTLEIVLGLDNVIFLAILTDRLPENRRHRTRNIGLVLAMVMRIALLLAIFWVMRLTTPLFEVPFFTETVTGGADAAPVPLSISGRDLILVLGGLFLLAKATFEIHHLMERSHEPGVQSGGTDTVGGVLTQVMLLDLVFSLDSVIMAVGMADRVEVMIVAVIVAVIVMIVFAGTVSRFIANHPSMKTLALAFLVMIGVLLVADGLGQHLPRGYVYFAMSFSLLVELINLKAASRRQPAEASG
jgi:predicted tellurium resistance membrane protein TerC